VCSRKQEVRHVALHPVIKHHVVCQWNWKDNKLYNHVYLHHTLHPIWNRHETNPVSTMPYAPGRLCQFILCRRRALWVSHSQRIVITASVLLEFCLLVHVPQQAILIHCQIACSILHKLPKMKFGRFDSNNILV
jgi:hypothetical protein